MFGLFSIAVNAVARECYEKSPGYVRLNDEYFNVEDNKDLTDKEKTKLASLYSSLEGKWKGEFSKTGCTGPDNDPLMSYENATLVSEIGIDSNGNLIVNAAMKFVKDRISK